MWSRSLCLFPRYWVAALENVATHPTNRGRGYSHTVCARLCQILREDGIEYTSHCVLHTTWVQTNCNIQIIYVAT